ncbi:hypothetical protein KPSA1_03293 [Pseudomonas syringae pv. actinidiae]|uniref:Uncharacterized protein n=1 Tax=Pseudomonas syringae pv. actinidiae TaxID=103796 RepID=A0A2V0QA67_PSESF|nr:hypothetical protein KPSA1_03293 [Pseudomonas syringae pv. actinidiae]
MYRFSPRPIRWSAGRSSITPCVIRARCTFASTASRCVNCMTPVIASYPEKWIFCAVVQT